MRTTLTLEDRIVRDLKDLAHHSGKPFKTVVNETLRAGLAAKMKPSPRRRFRQRTAALGAVLPGFNIDKAMAIADALEDEEIIRKLDLRK